MASHRPHSRARSSYHSPNARQRHESTGAAMDFDGYLSQRRPKPGRHEEERRNLRLIASPVNQDLHRSLGQDSSYDLERIKSRPESIRTTASALTLGNPLIYRRQHEASTIELFYDLFFVANLAYFTAMHQHVDAPSVLNYLKLFTLMWFTWLSTILYDVRFSMDSVYNRVCKLAHFGVMTAFVFAGPVFDTDEKPDDQRYYKSFAIVLFVSRLVTAIEYAVVIFHSRRVKKTIVPLGMTSAVYASTSVVYLVTHFAFPDTGPIREYEMLIWFLLSIFEGLATLLIAIFWRNISFKYTHLVERLGLLSLILMGEGIIGMVKSVACITKGQNTNTSAEIGTVVSSVILIYLIWILYFDQIDHHRFGTIRQQIWALLHYPLHVAILLTVEGNTSLIVWNSVVQGLKYIWRHQPLPKDAPGTAFATSEDFINFVNVSMVAIDKQFKGASWASEYPWGANLTTLANISSTHEFKSPEWNNATIPILNRMYTSAELFIFLSHKETMDKVTAAGPRFASASDGEAALQTIYAIFDVVVLYFYVCAGGMLLILAIMYWFGKLHKTKYEFGEIINRTIVGFLIPAVGVVATLTDKSTSGFKFAASNWLIPLVLFGFLIVVVLDNIILALAYFTDKHRKRSSRWTVSTYVEPPADDDDDMVKLVARENKYDLRDGRQYDSASLYSRNTTYQPYDSHSERPQSRLGTPPRSRAGSRAPSPQPRHSRAPSPQPRHTRAVSPAPPRSRAQSPAAALIPIELAMQGSFRPSHARTRSAGYAAVNVDEFDDYMEEGVGAIRGRRD